jgi:hypothetical protein
VSYPSKNSKTIGKRGKKLLRVQYPTIIGLILKTLGLKAGKKILTNPKVPRFLFNTSEEVIAEHLAQAIADDGCVPKTSRSTNCFVSIILSIDVSHISDSLREKIKTKNISKYAPNILKDDKRLFEMLGIKVNGPHFFREYHYTKGKNKWLHQWEISISGWKNLCLLSRKIKIPLGYKQRNLERALSSYTPPHIMWLDNIDDLKGKITTRNLRKKLNLTYEQSRGALRWLYTQGLVNKTYFRDEKGVLLAEYNFTSP